MTFDFPPYPPHSPKTEEKVTVMSDILCVIATVGFFGLMIVFMWACEKI